MSRGYSAVLGQFSAKLLLSPLTCPITKECSGERYTCMDIFGNTTMLTCKE